ncbi:unnamed protein product [Fusarium graminearum]|uniref:Uncharacterized protein n=1 Tax=Gibberella zeae TaxID=5518 RepID=A0A4V6J9U5_GIBZA|nr:unnamed protein product [Fusarium graminearum]CAF3552839.1 unnamed protein product [Fusarium graminearum]CAF3567804.1 unnamed protein product [Fusarium graminearum]CAG1962393.1 unnamed protein product [Fusarium graminearum]CAG1976419.1 unnamed protein product [Fusarium graminearum]
MCNTICVMTRCMECRAILERSFGPTVPCDGMKENGVCNVSPDVFVTEILSSSDNCSDCIKRKEELEAEEARRRWGFGR